MTNIPIVADSIRSIIYFVAAAKAGSFTTAADELGISKSALGKSIAKLELHLSTKLFHRTTRKLSLTTEGEAYLASCESALTILEAAELSLKNKQQRPSGNVRIDVPSAFGRQVVMPLLLKMAAQYPELKLTITFNDKLIDPLDSGFDLAFRFGALKDSGDLIAKQLNEQRLILCASPDYLAQYGLPVSLEELNAHRCVMAWRGGRPLPWLVKSDSGDDVYCHATPHHQISDGDAMVDACVAGAGIIQFPESLLRPFIVAGELVPILPALTPSLTGLNLIWPSNRHLMPGVRFIIDEFVRISAEGKFA
jgi:DNA-binding transcriptional LysR family regulator